MGDLSPEPFPGGIEGQDWTRYVGAGGNGSCCTGTGLENHTKYQGSIYFRSADDSTLYVNLFTASTLDWAERGLVISQATNYPAEGSSTLRVEQGGGQLDIKLRVPSWAETGYTVRINGVAQPVQAAAGSYLTLSRQWAQGDTIAISVPLGFRIETTPDDRAVQSIFYGPSLMVSQGEEASLTSASNRQDWRELTLYKHFTRDGDFAAAFSPTDTPLHFTGHGFTFAPFHVADPGTPLRYHAYFLRSEPTIVFGSHDSGVPNDDRGDGWTFFDVVWAEAPFDSHASCSPAWRTTLLPSSRPGS